MFYICYSAAWALAKQKLAGSTAGRWMRKPNEIIKAALRERYQLFDTAMSYQGGTIVEMFVGRALRDFARREDVVLATKFEPRTDEEIANGVTGQRREKLPRCKPEAPRHGLR